MAKMGRPPTGEPQMVKVTVYMPPAMKKQVEKVAGASKLSAYARKAIKKQLKKDR